MEASTRRYRDDGGEMIETSDEVLLFRSWHTIRRERADDIVGPFFAMNTRQAPPVKDHHSGTSSIHVSATTTKCRIFCVARET